MDSKHLVASFQGEGRVDELIFHHAASNRRRLDRQCILADRFDSSHHAGRGTRFPPCFRPLCLLFFLEDMVGNPLLMICQCRRGMYQMDILCIVFPPCYLGTDLQGNWYTCPSHCRTFPNHSHCIPMLPVHLKIPAHMECIFLRPDLHCETDLSYNVYILCLLHHHTFQLRRFDIWYCLDQQNILRDMLRMLLHS